MKKRTFHKILLIQTASIGDVILATPVLEKLKQFYPTAEIDFIVKRGIEPLLFDHPLIRKVFIWDKTHEKYRDLLFLCMKVRKEKYDLVVNMQRFLSSGLITISSGSSMKIGFKKNPLSLFFNRRIDHIISSTGTMHETDRNLSLIRNITDNTRVLPKLYPTAEHFAKVSSYKAEQYITISPASLWFTKQLRKEQWIDFIKRFDNNIVIYLLGAKQDIPLCNEIIEKSGHPKIQSLSGKLSLLESAALMRNALMNYVNDSAPMHLASAMNANTTAVFCSTVPAFGFGPLSEQSFIVEAKEAIPCRPCGLHGYKECPQKHFNCSKYINPEALLETFNIVKS